jgi:hypothetical protein
MKRRMAYMFLLPVLLVAAAFAQTSTNAAPQSTSSVVGIWRAEMRGLPALTLNITDESGSLSGAVLFYLLRREPGKAETATPGVPEPLIGAHFDGHVLTFAVSHRRAHPPASLHDAPVNFRLQLTGDNKGQLIRENDTSSAVEMVKGED